MFLSKIGGVYYLFFKDENGVRHKVSTASKKKPDALQFLRDFKREEYEAKKKLEAVLFSEFVNQYAAYASSVHTAKTLRTYQTAFREWLRIEGNRCLNTIGIREIEHFLSVKKVEASEWTARKYYIALASAFEKAVRVAFHLSESISESLKAKGEGNPSGVLHRIRFQAVSLSEQG